MLSPTVRLRKDVPATAWAYLAGVIEGDGTVCVSTNRSGITLQVLVTNGNLRLLEWIQQTVGGGIKEKSNQGQLGRSTIFQWVIKQKDSARLCEQLMPYLVGKRHQAELLKEAQELRDYWGKRRPRLIRTRLQEIAQECSWWNRQGWRADNEEAPPQHDSGPSQIRLVV